MVRRALCSSLAFFFCGAMLADALTVGSHEETVMGFRSISPEEGLPTLLPQMPGSLNLHRQEWAHAQDHAKNTMEWTNANGEKELLEVTSSVGAMQDPFKTGNSKMKLVGIETRLAGGRMRKRIVPWNLPKTLGLDGLENAFQPGTGDWVKGEGAPNFRFHTKVKHINQWLQKQDPDDFVIYIDSDVIYGGCSEEQFMREFNKIMEASGASMITGAELGCAAIEEPNRQFKCPSNSAKMGVVHRNHTFNYMERPEWAKKLYEDDQKTWVDPGYVDTKCVDFGAGPCSDPPQMIFLNSGFAAGTARDLMELYDYMEEAYAEKRIYGKYASDMNTYNQYFYNGYAPHPKISHKPKARLTLDDGSRLVTNLHAVNSGIEYLGEVKPYYKFNSTSLFEATSDGNIKSKITGDVACFIHGNGNAKQDYDKLKRMTLAMRGQKDPYNYKTIEGR